MIRGGCKKQANDSIHGSTPLTFVEWMHQDHNITNTGLPGRCLETRKLYLDVADRMTDPEELDCSDDRIAYYSEIDGMPWELESNPKVRELLEDAAPPLKERKAIRMFRQWRWC